MQEARETAASLAEMHGKFLQFLRCRVGDPAAAEDILQGAYLKAMEHSMELRKAESSVAWFYRVLRNAVADHYRRIAASGKAMSRMTAEWSEAYELEFEAETCACIREVLRDLKPEYRAAIEYVDLAGNSVESLARAANTTANNASVRLHRARKAVAQRLMAVCGTCGIHQYIDCNCKQRSA
ncbi:MAG TPA: sigma-70 family RNA polymerase sigma factor [Terracidiphilus sp.]|nr:sigma-70 family RNA polymerase sigma factor [Terracidiphilus sp.]